MLKRAALNAGKDCGVDNLGHFLHLTLRSGNSPRIVKVLAYKNDASTWTTQGLVGGGSDYVGIFDRIAQQSRGNQACRMGHIHPENGAHLVGNFTHTHIIPFTGISRSTAYNQFWTMFKGFALHIVIVNHSGGGIQTIRNGIVQYP